MRISRGAKWHEIKDQTRRRIAKYITGQLGATVNASSRPNEDIITLIYIAINQSHPRRFSLVRGRYGLSSNASRLNASIECSKSKYV